MINNYKKISNIMLYKVLKMFINCMKLKDFKDKPWFYNPLNFTSTFNSTTAYNGILKL